jgi:CheY-like chemotaxis protein
MSQTTTISPAARLLIVDDNKIYRDAFRRTLRLQHYAVLEAEDGDEAVARVAGDSPDAVITDLQMRTETEGLDLIRQLKASNPLLPVIMISAVGSFEEGAMAQKLGAAAVISKSRIEDEIERLYKAISAALDEARRGREQLQRLEAARAGAPEAALAEVRSLIANPDTHPYVRAEAFNVFVALEEQLLREESRKRAEGLGQPAPIGIGELEALLRDALPSYDSLTEDSRENLRIAEYLYQQQSHSPGQLDFSRNIGFSYCFAVENETKLRMSKRLQKFLSAPTTYEMIPEMMESKNQNLSVYYHQYILLLLRQRPMDFTVDNVRQTFRRILEHQSRYKPDGLKALGIMLIAFGRVYTWTRHGKVVRVNNPLGIKGFDTDDEVLHFASLLVSLQHYRNPYIHPEISDLEKLSIIRSTTFECLNTMSRLQ